MKTIYNYIRNKKNGKRLGIVVAIGKGKVGWSKCADHDIFDKNVGLSLAVAGLEHPELFPNRKTPPEFVKFVKNMNERSFKVKSFDEGK